MGARGSKNKQSFAQGGKGQYHGPDTGGKGQYYYDPAAPQAKGGKGQQYTGDLIPRTSMLVDDVSYDLWKGSGGAYGAGGFGRGLGERYENGDWCVHHPSLVPEYTRISLGQQDVDTFGVYGALWSSAVRPVTAFGVRISSRELRSLREGVYVVGLTPYSVFNPTVRPHRDAWLPALLCTERGTVSLAGERAQFEPWHSSMVEVGFVVQVGSGPGRIKITVFINGEQTVRPTEISFPREDSLHLFCFLNFFGDVAELLPHWTPPQDLLLPPAGPPALAGKGAPPPGYDGGKGAPYHPGGKGFAPGKGPHR
eukprot:TRINITY_DN17347_c0_g2_i1.p1 TRINITY_DN17347_c0_g2~~TRINITY_DN17347_c0_g2_i1.p1  ORF type:complete len:340 (+),score=109.81 TRINITY_DN17347_c0_g2_i1:91-1020(+)